MEYVVQREELEAKRKEVEAQDIARANQIIGESLRNNPEYIQWYYLQILDDFAKSENNAVIVVPVPSSMYSGVNRNSSPTIPLILPSKG